MTKTAATVTQGKPHGKRGTRAPAMPKRRLTEARPDAAPAAPLTASDTLDRELAASAMRKREAGERPTAREIEALRRIEKARDEVERWVHYRACPLKDYRRLAGKSAKTIREHADRYELPIGPRVDLGAVLRRFHELLVENRYRLVASSVATRETDPLMVGGNSAALERYRDEKAKLARLDRMQREGELMDRSDVHEILARVAARFRSAGDALQRRFGAEAAELMNQAIDDVAHAMEALFGGDDDGEATEPAPA